MPLPMTLARLRQILDAYGADSRRWPESERAAALTLIADSPEAGASRAQAAALDALLDGSAAPAPSPELMAEILAAAEPSSWRRRAAEIWPFGPIWQPASAMAMAAALGLAIGAVAPGSVLPDLADAAIEEEVEALAFGPALTLEDGL